MSLNRMLPAPPACSCSEMKPSNDFGVGSVKSTISVPFYGKLEILSFRDSTVTFKVLTDLNCGFRELVPGLPKN